MKREDYQLGSIVGMEHGVRDGELLLEPYAVTKDGTESYQSGYKNGYFLGYTESINCILGVTPTEEVKTIIKKRIEELNALKTEEPILKKR